MPTFRILKNGQIFLPAEFRKDLGLKKGDIVDAEIQDGKIIITPVTLIEKSTQAKEKFFKKVDELRERIKDVPLEEIKAAIVEAVTAKQTKKELERDLIEKACGMLKGGKTSTQSLLRFRAEERKLEAK